MSNTKHTLGEWKISAPIKGYVNSIMNEGICIADLPDVEITTDNIGENIANAKLIAAAPDMFDFINDVLVDMNETWGDQIRDGKVLLEVKVDADKIEKMLELLNK